MKKFALGFILLLALCFVMVSLPEINIVKASGTIYIKADGSVEPSTAPILKNGNVYTLIRNMTGTISIYRGNVVVNGAGYTIQNPHGTTGVRIFSHGVAVINLTITKTGGSTTEDDIGIEILHGSHALIANNTIIGNQRIKTASIYAESAIYIYVGSNNTIVGNTIKDNQEGLYFIAVMGQGTASNNLIYGNNFINNTQNVVNAALLASTPLNTWNNTSFGNYWSDYNGTDANLDGIGDTPYVIDANNQDNYPLMTPFNISSIELPELPGAPSVFVVSPENATYTAASVPLNFTVSRRTSWMGYSLDGQENVTVTENTTLTGLSNGLHTLTVYANDTFGYTGASETIYFTIAQQSVVSDGFFPTLIVAAIAIIAIGGVALLVYFRKIRKTTEKAE